jgi:CheY-like chemotaxis protein
MIKTALRRMLAVDDLAMNVLLLEELLAPKLLAWQIVLDTAGTASEGLKLASERSYCLLLLDLHLPDFNGDVLLTRLRADANAASQRAPAFALTGELDQASAANLRLQGFAQVFGKPWDMAVLMTAIESVCAHPQLPLNLAISATASEQHAAFDHVLALKSVGGKPELMLKLRAMLLSELQTRLPLLRASFFADAKSVFEEHRHRIAGAASFTGAYKLAAALEQMRQTPSAENYQQLESAITEIIG